MRDDDEHRIGDVEALREIVGESPARKAPKIMTSFDDFAVDYLQRAPFLVLATSDADGNLDASPKGDGPGFILVEDEHTLVIPDRPGNRLVMGHLNILENPRVGLLFMIPGTNETLRVNGRAELRCDPDLLERLAARGRPAVLAIRIHVDEIFFHCAKAFIRSKLWQPDTWGERHRVSFGEMLAKKLGGDTSMAEKVDAAIGEDYRTRL